MCWQERYQTLRSVCFEVVFTFKSIFIARYADKLSIPAVYDTFKNTILKNARKLPMLKNETKMLLDELEKQIDEVRQKGLDEPEDEGAEEQNQNSDGVSPSVARSKRPTRDTRMDTSPAVAARSQKKRTFATKKEKAKKRVISSSDESDGSKDQSSSEDDSE